MTESQKYVWTETRLGTIGYYHVTRHVRNDGKAQVGICGDLDPYGVMFEEDEIPELVKLLTGGG